MSEAKIDPRKWLYRLSVMIFCSAVSVNHAAAHASNQAFVPLLPVDFYINGGVAIVVLTILMVALPRLGFVLSAGPSLPLPIKARDDVGPLKIAASLISLAVLAFLIYMGQSGSTDPLANPLPLYIWTVWWIGVVCVNAVVGNIWPWLNPWTGLYVLLFGGVERKPFIPYPETLGHIPAMVGYAGFVIFMLASWSPEDPRDLSMVVGFYWALTFVGMVLFGAEPWMRYGECFSILMSFFAKAAVLGQKQGRLALGPPGWQLALDQKISLTAAFFTLLVLGANSFDGFNETFLWLDILGINPLEFPGRSAIFWQTLAGLAVAVLALITLYSFALVAGLALVGESGQFGTAFVRFSITLIPIAVAYHIAHFYTSFLVNIQYSWAATSDPWASGADYLGLGTFYVTTGFFNNLDSVRVIFLTQISVVVIGHVVSILAAHAVALSLLKSHKKAVLSQIPLGIFMIAYTFFGLWLLAAPRGA